ncbi:hypothetical protein ACFJIX_29770 [Roseateles sp. UC29_93]|uniref:hypothetical protein n=1 Tax=Roseateles sp. UC29_93 TaxID=3350177 RepID=UPI00366F6A91
MVARGLTDLDATLRRVVLPLPPGRDGSAETLIRLRAISAHLAQSAADTAQRRALAEQLIRWDVVSHMIRMNRADGHQQRFPDSAIGGRDQECWHQLDAVQACANANYMTLLGRLATSGALTPEEVWTALSTVPPGRTLDAYLNVAANTLCIRPPQPHRRLLATLDLGDAGALAQLLGDLLPRLSGLDDRSPFERLAAVGRSSRDDARTAPPRFYDRLLPENSRTTPLPLALFCRELDALDAGVPPPRRAPMLLGCCAGAPPPSLARRFEAALKAAPSSDEFPRLGQRHPKAFAAISDDLAGALDWDEPRSRWGYRNAVSRFPLPLYRRWKAEDFVDRQIRDVLQRQWQSEARRTSRSGDRCGPAHMPAALMETLCGETMRSAVAAHWIREMTRAPEELLPSVQDRSMSAIETHLAHNGGLTARVAYAAVAAKERPAGPPVVRQARDTP